MKRKIASTLAAGIFSAVCLVGCTDEAKTTESEKVVTPGGTTETTVEKKIDSKGSNPPPNSAGETAKPPK